MKNLKPQVFYQYRFEFPDGKQKQFNIDFDKKSKSNIVDADSFPDWACLEFNQCKNCPLTCDDSLYCPLAINLVPIIEWSEDLVSYDEVDVTVISAEREVRVHTNLQRAISSLLGLLMSISDCPRMHFLRPLARFHLPLATHEETIYRAVSMQFLRKYFDKSVSVTDEEALADLKKQYKEIQDLNEAMAKRIRAAIHQDAAVNAIVLLDILSKRVSFSIDDSLEDIRYLFFENSSDVA